MATILKTARAALLLSALVGVSAVWAQAAPQAATTADPCAPGGALFESAKANKEAHKKEIETAAEDARKKAQEQASCLARAQDSVIRAAIPPSLGSILGVLADPVGMVQGAVGNAACNVITTETNKATGEMYKVQSGVRNESYKVQQGVTGAINGALGGQAGNISTPPIQQPQQPQRSRLDELTCRVFGRC